MNPAELTIKNSRTSIVLYLIIMLVGVTTFLTIGNREYPKFTIRNAVVITQYPGRSAVQVEEEVSEPLEQAIRQLTQVHEVKSTSKAGVSIITVEVDESYFEMEDIWTDMRNKINEAPIPKGASKPLVNDDFGDEFPYIYALTGKDFTPAELKNYGDSIRDRLLAVDGVGKVEFHGTQKERIYLEFNSNELAARGLSPLQVSQQLKSQNSVVNSGSADHGDERLQVVTLGEFDSLDELANYPLIIPGESSGIKISDLFIIKRDYLDPPSSVCHFNGEPVLCIAVSMNDGGVVTEIGAKISAEIKAIQNELPLGLEIETMFYQPTYVTASINSFISNLVQAFCIVVIIMFIFSGWRLALLVSILIPSAILLCFTFMPTLGIEMEMMSIAALIIALGILVDNGVVVCEQILSRLNEGAERSTAVFESVKGLVIPLLAGSGTTIAAFGIIAMAKGSTAEFTFSLFAVVALTLLGSWIISLTIIPFFAYYFLKPLKKDTLVGRALTKVYSPYEALLRFSLRTKWIIPIIVICLTCIAGWAMKYVPTIFFPPNERGQLVVDFELPLGKNIATTEAEVKQLETWLLENKKDQVKSVSSWIGNGGPRWYLSLSPEQAKPNYAFLSILTTTEDPEAVAKLSEELNDYAYEHFPAARVSPKMLESGPPVGDPIQIKLTGDDLDTLYELRDKISILIKDTPGTYGIRDSWGAWTKQVTIDPDPIRASRLGLTTSDIASAIDLQYIGTTATNYRENEKSIPIVLRSRDDYRSHLDQLKDLPIFGSQQGIIPLSQVGDIKIEFQPGSILRKNTIREITLLCRVRGRYSSEVLADLKPKINSLIAQTDWPTGYKVEWGGEQAESAEAQEKLAAGAPIPIAVLCIILIAQFNSIRAFLIIMLTIPPMLIGVAPGLIVTGSSFGFMTLLGLIALMGIVVNNAILLIDETRMQAASGNHPNLMTAIVESAKSRLRPIIMTTATTVLGLLPLALGGGKMWSSMAYTMMFGLAFATFLTLLLCPTLYYIFYHKQEKREKAPEPEAELEQLLESKSKPEPEAKTEAKIEPKSL
jgi:multidrug efflux pump subunit AcrB